MKENWKKVKLGDHVDVFNGHAFKSTNYVDSGYQVIRIGNVQDGYITNDNYKAIELRSGELERFILSDGDLLVSLTGNVGRVGFICGNNLPAVLNQRVGKLIIKSKELESKYLYYFMKAKSTRLLLEKNAKGIAQKNIGSTDIENLVIPLPPINAQREVIDALDKADELTAKRTESIELLDEYLRSVFLDMFGDPVSNPKKLPIMHIDMLGDVITGSTPSRKVVSYYGDYIEWIKSDNLNNDSYYLTKASECLSKKGSEKGRVVPSGSVLVTCIAGSLDCIGNAGIADRDVSFNQQINAIIPDENLITTEYLFSHVLFGKKLFKDASNNSMKGMLNKTKFSKIELMVPSLEKQKEYSAVFNKVYANKVLMKEQLSLLNNNFQMQLSTL